MQGLLESLWLGVNLDFVRVTMKQVETGENSMSTILFIVFSHSHIHKTLFLGHPKHY